MTYVVARNLAEKIGSGAFVVGLGLTVFADGLWKGSPHKLSGVWIVSGIVMTVGGLLTWAIGHHARAH